MPLVSPEKSLPFVILAIILLMGIALIRVCVADANRRGRSPILVCLLVLFFFPLGLIVWLLFRPEPV